MNHIPLVPTSATAGREMALLSQAKVCSNMAIFDRAIRSVLCVITSWPLPERKRTSNTAFLKATQSLEENIYFHHLSI